MGLFANKSGGIFSGVINETIREKDFSIGYSKDSFTSGNGINVFDNSEKKRQAYEYINQAKQFVSEGKDIYERAYRQTTTYATETEYKLRQHSEYKQRLAEELGSNVKGTLKNFDDFNIDSRIVQAPTINNYIRDMGVFQSTIANCMPRTEELSLFESFMDGVDYYKAKKQRDEARQYKERMKMERDRLNRRKEQMSEIQTFISSEKIELDSLMFKVRKMTEELNSGLKKSSFSKEEADYLKGIHKITEHIVNLLSTQFLTDSLSINSKYQQIYDGVKSINKNLPNAPSIHDRSTLDVIKRIVDGTIVY
ncbi:MAG: hypothetical protein PUC12_06080 [Clostridiales bacterium]|nr:hypothetical protein [Clostridiales bacterium]